METQGTGSHHKQRWHGPVVETQNSTGMAHKGIASVTAYGWIKLSSTVETQNSS